MLLRLRLLPLTAALSCSILLAVAPLGASAERGSDDAQIQTDVQKALDNSRFKDVHATVQNGNVTLRGTVADYADKESADNKAHHIKKVKGVDNQIEVAGPPVDDAKLRDKLANALAYDRVVTGRQRSMPSPSACRTAW